MNADSTNPNSSALWQRPFVQYACANQATQWYMPAYDSDGDSLVYSQVMPRERDLKFPDPLDTLIQDIQYKAPIHSMSLLLLEALGNSMPIYPVYSLLPIRVR
ncbi:MAG: hypothetical protein R2831_10305 [Chitinophagaceae bacterium]